MSMLAEMVEFLIGDQSRRPAMEARPDAVLRACAGYRPGSTMEDVRNAVRVASEIAKQHEAEERHALADLDSRVQPNARIRQGFWAARQGRCLVGIGEIGAEIPGEATHVEVAPEDIELMRAHLRQAAERYLNGAIS